MRSHPLVRAACASVLAAGLSLAASAVAQGEMVDDAESIPKQVGVIDDTGGLPHVKQENGISYISGGAGSDEADALNSMSGQFNLKLTMTVPVANSPRRANCASKTHTANRCWRSNPAGRSSSPRCRPASTSCKLLRKARR